jgi:histone deacetylase 11
MNIYYHTQYNIDLGILNRLHPFDGVKFSRIYKKISRLPQINIKRPDGPISQDIINNFANELLQRLLSSKRYILNALEVPYIPLLPFSLVDKRILVPMRWGVKGTIEASKDALSGNNSWNLSGGYHHASPNSAEGFCIYNDVGIAYETHLKNGDIARDDRVLIVDVDAHHGNGNAHTFMGNNNVTILDAYNDNTYPQSPCTKKRVDISVQFQKGVTGPEYIKAIDDALNKIEGSFRIAFVIAGTDVLASDPLGGFNLSVEDCTSRDSLIFEKLKALSIPFVFLGGGGYSKNSTKAIVKSISNLYLN